MIEIKILPKYFIKDRNNRLEARLAKFDLVKGSIIRFREWDAKTKKYTGRFFNREVADFHKIHKATKHWSREDLDKYGIYIFELKNLEKKFEKDKFIDGHYLDGRKEKVNVKELVFRPAIYAIIIKKDKVLLSPQWDGYDFPGGGVGISETLDEAFKREVFEETGLRVQKGEVVEVINSFFISRRTKEKFNSLQIYCLAKSIKGKITDKHFEDYEKKFMKKAVWLPIKDIKKIKFYNEVDSGKIIYNALKIIKHGGK